MYETRSVYIGGFDTLGWENTGAIVSILSKRNYHVWVSFDRLLRRACLKRNRMERETKSSSSSFLFLDEFVNTMHETWRFTVHWCFENRSAANDITFTSFNAWKMEMGPGRIHCSFRYDETVRFAFPLTLSKHYVLIDPRCATDSNPS